RAVVAQGVAPSFEAALTMLAQHPGPFPDLARALTEHVAEIVGQTPVGGVVKMVIGEARNFPELARVWHDQLVGRAIEALAGAVAAAQARGEVRPGDPRAHALTLISPLLVGVIWRETFTPIGAEPFDLPALARLHVETVLSGMLERAA